MSMDIKITEAIEAAVEEAGQPPAVAKRMVAWLEAINSGKENIDDPARSERRLEVLYEGTIVDKDNPLEGKS